MKKLRERIYKFLPGVLLATLVFIPSVYCKASSATIGLTTKNEEVTVGDEFIVNIKLSSEDLLGDFEGYIAYDSNVLEFVSDASFIAGGEGLLKVTDTNVADGDNERKYAVKFKAKAIGSSEITIKDNSSLFDYESGDTMSISSNHLKVTVKAKSTASDNNYLKSLKISPGTLTPEFNKDTYKYSTTVESDVEKLIVSTQTEDEKAAVTIKGNEGLAAGVNKVIISVKAESGDIKKYEIDVTKAEKNNTDEINTQDETDNINDSETSEYNNSDNDTAQVDKIEVIQDGDNLFIQNGFKYQLVEKEESVEIPDGYIETTIILDEITIPAYTLENDLDNDFLLLYAKKGDSEPEFYRYDRKEGTIQRYVENNIGDNKVVYSGDMMNSDEYKDKLTAMGIVIAVLGSICIILSVLFIRIFLKNKEE